MIENSTYSKESIKNRMLTRIALLWDVRSTENVEPLIKRLIEALSSEIFKLFGELSDVENRLLSRLAMSMTPTAQLTAIPSNAVVHIQPKEVESEIDLSLRFSYINAAYRKQYGINKILFTPISPYKIYDIHISKMVVDTTLYSIEKNLMRDSLGYAIKRDENNNYTAWLGLDINDNISTLENLSLYFDLTHIDNKSDYLRLLPYSKWSLKGEPLNVSRGYFSPNIEETSDKVLYKPSAMERICQDLKTIYSKNYLTINSPLKVEGEKELFPKELQSFYSKEALETLTKPLLWLKVVFPTQYSADILEHLHVSVNTIPIVNMTRHKNSSLMKDVSTFVALNVAECEYFLDVESVSDTTGKQYVEFNQSSYASKYPDKLGIYTLRRGGCERFAVNDAKNYLVRLIDIMRDESLSFSGVNQEELKEGAYDLLRCIKVMEQNSKIETNKHEQSSYLLVDKTTFDETLIIDYWTTNGPIINNIKAGTPLTIEDATGFLSGDSFLLTTTKGAEYPPDISRIGDIYRYHLTSRESLFTRSDVETFCRVHYGDNISRVKVERSVSISDKPKYGIINTIDVYITPKNNHIGSTIKEELQDRLETHSPDHYNYRVFITE